MKTKEPHLFLVAALLLTGEVAASHFIRVRVKRTILSLFCGRAFMKRPT